MQLWKSLALLAIAITIVCAEAQGEDVQDQMRQQQQQDLDNEFAEFEDFEEESSQSQQQQQQQQPRQQRQDVNAKGSSSSEQYQAGTPASAADDDVFIENEETEGDADFDHFQDSEEFEGHDSSERGPMAPGGAAGPGTSGDLKITSVPLHLRASWQSYYAEMLMCAALAVYFINFLSGRSKNTRLANAWFESHRSILEANFALVGDDGLKEIQSAGLRKESENCFTLWCSGRQYVEGMLVELRLIKRQCLVGVLAQIMRPSSDQITFKLTLDAMDPLVFCVATKKTSSKLTKDLIDIQTFCPDRKSLPERAVREIGDGFVVHSEIGEITQAFFQDSRVIGLFSELKDSIEMLHISDQYQGQNAVRPGEDASQAALLKKPDTERVIILRVALPGRGRTSDEQIAALTDLLRLTLFVADKTSRLRLSKEARAKADKNRQKVEETFLKSTHAQRQELAQQRRDERIRMERERILAEDDPEKQRRLELKEQKRLAKKSTPKLKQMKVRAM